ncbi:hypothetical protein CPC08DRAFT_715761 [Agrocybe pediades]|nr:hypothetical protein CPC08DRAFT_715761 [Agrocybe pediades]
MSSISPDHELLATTSKHLLAVKYFQIAAYVMLIYDHMLTLSMEVERIWKRKFSGASMLFLINRYVTPLQFIVIIDAFQDPVWTKEVSLRGAFVPEVCDRFVAFEGGSTIALIAFLMILRVYALYGRNNWILAFLGFLWTMQIALSSLGISTGFAVPLPAGLVGCIFSGENRFSPMLWAAPLITDTFIFSLIMWQTRAYLIRSATHSPTLQVFVRDGLLYFIAISAANLLNMLTFILAPLDLKTAAASFSQILTSTMVSRLILNLRSVPYDNDETYSNTLSISLFFARTLRPLGEDTDGFDEDMPPLHDIPRRDGTV